MDALGKGIIHISGRMEQGSTFHHSAQNGNLQFINYLFLLFSIDIFGPRITESVESERMDKRNTVPRLHCLNEFGRLEEEHSAKVSGLK